MLLSAASPQPLVSFKSADQAGSCNIFLSLLMNSPCSFKRPKLMKRQWCDSYKWHFLPLAALLEKKVELMGV